MIRRVVTVSFDDTLETIMEILGQAGFHHPARDWTARPAIVW
ncbi:CBS domain-containing protein [Paraburkholderia franconis]|nr:hypothetical protein [Paraburkholderia franconis]